MGDTIDGANMQSRKVMFIIDDKVVPVDQQLSLDKLDDSSHSIFDSGEH